MRLAVNKRLGHFSLLWKLAFLFTEQKMRALILQTLGVCCSGLHFRELACCLYGDTQTYIPHVHKQTHARAMYRNHVIHRQEAEIHKNTHTHSMQQRAYSVWWRDELPALYYQDDSSDSNQWKQDESLIKGEKCRHEMCLKTKRGFWQESGAAHSPRLGRGGT